jgi:alpha-glucoside transport system permease protein
MENRFLMAAIVLIGVPIVIVGYIWLTERALRLLPARRRDGVRPWLWLLPALAFVSVFLVYPTIRTLIISFMDKRSENFVGVENYVDFFTESGSALVLLNNLLWIIFFTLLTVVFGLLIAVLADRVRYESVAKAMIFLPMAISFVAAAIIWRFMYDLRPAVGTLNAGVGVVGIEPQTWLFEWPRNNFMIIIAAAWIWTGFCMVILSAGLKGISTELLEAARMDGANEFQVFFRIILPLLAPTVAVVVTTMIIFALKVFDLVYVMTGGRFDTDVLANRMFSEMFTRRDFGMASAVAVILLAIIVPIMYFNVRRFREQEAIR